MNITLLGATGRTGRPLLRLLADRGHRTTVLVRDPAKLGDTGPTVTVVRGDVRDHAALAEAVAGSDAVISALGPTTKDTDLHTATATALIATMREHGPRRFVGISGAGVDAPGDRKAFRDKVISFLINRLGGAVVKDKPAELAAWRDSGLDWTLVRPPRLLDGPATGEVEHHAHRSTRKTSITRADLAGFVVEVVEQDLYSGKAPFVANR